MMMPSNEKVDSVDDMKKKKMKKKEEEHVATTASGDAHELESLPSLETSDGPLSPKNVAGATIVPIGVNKYSLTHSQQNDNDNQDGTAIIDPSTDFGTIFEECKKHLQEKMYTNNNTHALMADNQGEVRKNLFQWHVNYK